MKGYSRRPVPAVEEEREQAEFEMDVKFLRERERRMCYIRTRFYSIEDFFFFYTGKFYRLMKQGMSGEEALAKVNANVSSQASNKDEDDDDDDENYLDEDSDLDEDDLN